MATAATNNVNNYSRTPEQLKLLERGSTCRKVENVFMKIGLALAAIGIIATIISIPIDATVVGLPVGVALKVAGLGLMTLSALCMTGFFTARLIGNLSQDAYYRSLSLNTIP